MKRGVDVYIQPTYVDPPLPLNILTLFTKQLVAPFDMILVHVEPTIIDASARMKEASDCVVGWTMWETSTFDNMDKASLATFSRRLEKFDHLFVYDNVCAEAIKPYYDNPLMLQGGYDPELWKPMSRDWYSEKFNFCMMGYLNRRKSPFTAIEAFKELKDSEPDFACATLSLKSGTNGLHQKMEQWCTDLHIYQEMWPEDQVRDFYSNMHVLLAPSRGEGKNLPALQFMSTGGAVVATNWSGHQNWLSSEYAYPLNYKLGSTAPEFPDCFDAEPDKEHLKEIMLHMVRNRGEVRRKAEIASKVIPMMCSWDNVFERFFNKLAEDGNPGIRDKWLMTQVSNPEELFLAKQGRM